MKPSDRSLVAQKLRKAGVLKDVTDIPRLVVNEDCVAHQPDSVAVIGVFCLMNGAEGLNRGAGGLVPAIDGDFPLPGGQPVGEDHVLLVAGGKGARLNVQGLALFHDLPVVLRVVFC